MLILRCGRFSLFCLRFSERYKNEIHFVWVDRFLYGHSLCSGKGGGGDQKRCPFCDIASFCFAVDMLSLLQICLYDVASQKATCAGEGAKSENQDAPVGIVLSRSLQHQL